MRLIYATREKPTEMDERDGKQADGGQGRVKRRDEERERYREDFAMHRGRADCEESVAARDRREILDWTPRGWRTRLRENRVARISADSDGKKGEAGYADEF